MLGPCDENRQNFCVNNAIVTRPFYNNVFKYENLVIVNALKCGSNSCVDMSDLEKFNEIIDLLIIAGANHYSLEMWQVVIKMFPNAKKLFFADTSKCKDGSPIFRNIGLPNDGIIYEISKEALVARGVLPQDVVDCYTEDKIMDASAFLNIYSLQSHR